VIDGPNGSCRNHQPFEDDGLDRLLHLRGREVDSSKTGLSTDIDLNGRNRRRLGLPRVMTILKD
jgi:hypothetical protein